MRYKLRKNVVELDIVFFRQLQPKSEKNTLRLTSKKKKIKKILKIGHGTDIVGKKRDHRILDPLIFSGKIRKNTKS